MNSAELIHDTLLEYGELTETAISQYMVTGEPVEFLYELIQDYPSRKGRMLRATLCLSTAKALGADVDAAMPAAVAIELLHNAFLIHDDIEDDSDTRRGADSLHKIHGVPLAINAGDGLSALAMEALTSSRSRLSPQTAITLVNHAQRTIRTTIEGQAMELGWRKNNSPDISISDVLTMILKKTCCYTTLFPIQSAAIIAGRSDVSLETFSPFGTMLGTAFQIQDDILNLAGDEQKYGKELNGDLYEGKRTLMLIHAMENTSQKNKSRAVQILGKEREEKTEEEVHWLRKLIEENDSIEYARMYANQLAGAAEQEATRLFNDLPDSREKGFLLGISRWVIERN